MLAIGGAHAAVSTQKLHQLVCDAVVETVLQQDKGALQELLAITPQIEGELQGNLLTFTSELSKVGKWLRPGEPLSADRLAAFSTVLNEVLKELQPPHGNDLLSDLPERLEFLSMQYVARNEIGSLRPARELQDSYLRMDITELAQSVDQGIQTLALERPDSRQLQDAVQRWNYIRNQFLHYKTLQPSSISVSVHSRFITAALRDERKMDTD
jgi:hypothetical protein